MVCPFPTPKYQVLGLIYYNCDCLRPLIRLKGQLESYLGKIVREGLRFVGPKARLQRPK